MRTGESILAGLGEAGRTLVFVDDGGTPGKPLPNLAADYALMCGVLVQSIQYPAIKAQLRTALSKLPSEIKEFHSTEIVNPGSKSGWKAVSPAERLNALRLLAELIAEKTDGVVFCYVSGEQYQGELNARIIEAGGPALGHKEALEKVFFNSLIKHLRQANVNAAIVTDSATALHDTIKIQAIADPAAFYEGGVIHAESWVEEGLQLADFAAYVLNRVHHAKHRGTTGKVNRFDEFITQTAERLWPMMTDLLSK